MGISEARLGNLVAQKNMNCCLFALVTLLFNLVQQYSEHKFRGNTTYF